jgi:hypothetical protein
MPSSWTRGRIFSRFRLVEIVENCETDILVSSIHRFKGLDSKVVILANVRDLQAEWLNQVFYVGASRARTYLTLLIDQQVVSLLPNTLKRRVTVC